MEAMAVKKKEARRDQILDAAVAVFGEVGYHAANVADIIAKAGVARGTFYQHFENKRVVFDELLDDLLERVRDAIVDVDMAHPEKTVYVQLQENVERVLGILFQERALARILLAEASGVDADLDLKLAGFYDGLLKLISETLQLGQMAGMVRACDTVLVATCILGSVKELVYQHTLRNRPPADVAAVAREIMAYNLQGLFTRR
ncbi:MAG: Transcriptional regulator, TetR family protein [Cyanobacteria bacterium RYN_339]|nr:Transcriptional regulator, TetR family protein [Cyanobacteria bacterium RYN_339]